MRLLKPGGHGTLHLISIHHLPQSGRTYEEECWNHVNNVDAHWMHYYSFDEILVLFSDALGVTDLDVKYYRTSFWVHFSKGTRADSSPTTSSRRTSSTASCPRRSGRASAARRNATDGRRNGRQRAGACSSPARAAASASSSSASTPTTGYDVIATCREPEKATELHEVAGAAARGRAR